MPASSEWTPLTKTQFSVLNWLRNVIKNKFPSQLSTLKPVFSAMLLSFARGSGWDQLLCVMTKLPASFRRPAPRFDVLPPLIATEFTHTEFQCI